MYIKISLSVTMTSFPSLPRAPSPDFCWVCLEKWDSHKGYYQCSKYKDNDDKENDARYAGFEEIPLLLSEGQHTHTLFLSPSLPLALPFSLSTPASLSLMCTCVCVALKKYLFYYQRFSTHTHFTSLPPPPPPPPPPLSAG